MIVVESGEVQVITGKVAGNPRIRRLRIFTGLCKSLQLGGVSNGIYYQWKRGHKKTLDQDKRSSARRPNQI